MKFSIDKKAIISAIESAESHTSSEIKIHIEKTCKETGPYERARKLFDKLKLYNTKNRNAVLIYLSYNDRQIAILGDKGINDLVDDHYWNDVLKILKDNFSEGKYTEGFLQAVQKVGEKLKEHFPFETGDKNEISDFISH